MTPTDPPGDKGEEFVRTGPETDKGGGAWRKAPGGAYGSLWGRFCREEKPRTGLRLCRQFPRRPHTALGMGTRAARAGPETSDGSCYAQRVYLLAIFHYSS